MLNQHAGKQGETNNGRDTGWALGGSSCPDAEAAAALRDTRRLEKDTLCPLERPTRGCGEAAILAQQGPRTQH